MNARTFDRILLFSLFFLAYWFFGNLYEEIVLAPNQLTDTLDALVCWQNYFTITNQIHYYVPFTQLAVVGICVLYFKSDHAHEKALLKKAALFGLFSILITVVIVTQLNLKIFFGDLHRYLNDLLTLAWLWLIGNAVRLYLVGSSLYYTFKTYSSRLTRR